jgi:O-acetyl-ADP-ribose deacetylase (regulator of RNase III)
MGGGVSAAIRTAGGPRVPADASKMVPAKVGDVVVSTAGDLKAKYVLHAVTIGPKAGEMTPAVVIRQTTHHAMQLLDSLRCKSIAFPAIGAGVAGISLETVAAEMATVLVAFLLDNEETYGVELWLKHRFAGMSDEDFFVFFEQFAARQLGVVAHTSTAGYALAGPPHAEAAMDAEQLAEAQRRHEVYTMLRHLDAQRNKLESELMAALTVDDGPDAERLAGLSDRLEKIQALRRNYERELTPLQTQTVGVRPNSVFVSSTSSDLKAHRQAARNAIEALNLLFVGMEDFDPARTAPADLIRQKVSESESYVGILGMRYGYVDVGTGLSMTQLEYLQAVASAKPILMFVIDSDAPITAGMVESDPVHFAKLLEFKQRVMKDHTCKLFTSPQDLADKVRSSVAKG